MNVIMNLAAADSIGRTLARLGQLGRITDPDVDTSRENILRIVAESETPCSVEDISGVTGLHANTIRTHLEVLRAAGRIERTRGNAAGRGRPRWLYSATESVNDPYHALSAELTTALTAAADPELAGQAAHRWRAADGVTHDPVDSPDEAVALAADALVKLGFDVDVSPVGNAIYLGRCPYAALVVQHPIICDIHARALEQLLAGTGQDVELESMDVFPRPGVCVAHLRRRDLTPHRVVEGTAPPTTAGREKKAATSRRRQ